MTFSYNNKISLSKYANTQTRAYANTSKLPVRAAVKFHIQHQWLNSNESLCFLTRDALECIFSL